MPGARESPEYGKRKPADAGLLHFAPEIRKWHIRDLWGLFFVSESTICKSECTFCKGRNCHSG